MLSIHEHDTLEEASTDLLSFVLDPRNWLAQAREVQSEEYQRRVGKLRISASVDVQPNLDTRLRVSFRAPGLSPLKAADHLETFLKPRLPLLPNTEWQVELDERSWIHFFRPYTLEKLQA
jgi:hypothetical protein